jgi:hypothetical protein
LTDQGVNLWWVNHDRLEGRVWLGLPDLQALVREMVEQGMAGDDPAQGTIPVEKLARGQTVAPREIAGALDFASAEPELLDDERLWQDWLRFLEGAATHGGIKIF